MADNYIEQRMADLASGKLSKSLQHPAPRRRSLLVISVGSSLDRSITYSFANLLRRNYRIALLSDDPCAKDLTLSGAIRYYPLHDEPDSQIPSYLDNLLRAWHSLVRVIIVGQNETAQSITDRIESFFGSLPDGVYNMPTILSCATGQLDTALAALA